MIARLRRLVPFVVLTAFWLLYSFTRPIEYSYDGLCYALDVERAPFGNLFHPNHLLYSFAQWLIRHAFFYLGYHGQAIYLMQAVNAFVGALAITGLGYTLAKLSTARVGWTLAAAMGLSQAFWVEVADPGCYAFAALAAVAWMASLVSPSVWRPGRLGVWHGFLALWHQMFVIAMPSGLIGLSWRERVRYLLGAALVYGAAYAWAAYTFHGPSHAEAWFWAFGPGGPGPGMKLWSSTWWSMDLWVNSKAWITAFSEMWVSRVGWSHGLRVAFDTVLIVGFFTLAWRTWRNRLFVIVACLSVFQFFFWIGALRYRILMMPFLLALIAPLLTRVTSRVAWGGLLTLVIGLGALNFLGPIHTRMQPTANRDRTAWVQSHVFPNHFFVFEGTSARSIENVHFAYFAPDIPAKSLKGYYFEHPDKNLAPLSELMRAMHQQGRTVVTEEPLLDLFPGWQVQGSAISPEGYALFQITPDLKAK